MNRRHLLASLLLLAVAHAASADAGSFAGWARERIVPIDADGKAFGSLDADLVGVKLVGMGESHHESEPFLSFRSALLKDLVRRHRVTALVLESGLPEVMAMDDYVRGRSSSVDFDAALPGGHGPLVGMREVMRWLREWNLGPGRDNPVGVYGADLPVRSGSMVPALDRITELTRGNGGIAAAVDAIRPTAGQIAHTWWKGATDKYAPLSPEAKAALTANVTRLVEIVERANGLDPEAHAWTRRMAFVVQQFEEMVRLGAFHPTMSRNRAMAGNTLWFVERLGEGQRAMYWAHNAHIQKTNVRGPALPPPGDFRSTGTFLHEALGKRYYTIGTAYGGPSRDKSAAPEEGSVDATLGAVASGPFLLRLSGGPSWLSEERPMRFQSGNVTVPLGVAFDAVVYFDSATPAARAAPSN